MIIENIYKEVLLEYEQLKSDVTKKLNKKKDFCYSKCNKIKEIDDKINMTGLKISKAVISANINDKKQYIENLKSSIESLKKQKEVLMLENGFPKDYFNDIYICRKCEDTGFINNEKCYCFKQKLINKAYGMSNIDEIIKVENFSKFSLEYYSKDEDKKNDMSPYKNMKLIMRRCTFFIEEFDEKFNNIVFYGKEGLGKTFLCRCIAKDLLDRGKIVLYVSAFSLFEMFEKLKFDKDNENINKNILNLTKESDLLIIDDLGTEFVTKLSTAVLFDIINSRILTRKSTIISTNLYPNELSQTYSGRVISRLYDKYEMIRFFGKDIRMMKKFQEKRIKNL